MLVFSFPFFIAIFTFCAVKRSYWNWRAGKQFCLSFSALTQFLSCSSEERASSKHLGQLPGLPARLPPAEESLHRLAPVHLCLSVVSASFVCLFVFQVIAALRPLVFVFPAALLACRRPWWPPLRQGRAHQPFIQGAGWAEQSKIGLNWSQLVIVPRLSRLFCFGFFSSLSLSTTPWGCFSACGLARYVSCQPWSRFLLRCLLDSGESCLLHPATLRLVALVRGTYLHAQTRAWHESNEISFPWVGGGVRGRGRWLRGGPERQ